MSNPVSQAASAEEQWLFEARSPFLKRIAIIGVVVIMIIHIFMAFIVGIGDTGVTLTSADQWSFIGIGLLFSGVCLFLLRPRVRIDERGVEVRNIANAQFYPWQIIHGLSFPAKAKMARLELPDFEFVPMMALNIYDKETIAANVERFRLLEDRYMPED